MRFVNYLMFMSISHNFMNQELSISLPYKRRCKWLKSHQLFVSYSSDKFLNL